MTQPLLKLLQLQSRAAIRRLARGLRTVRGALLAAVALGMVLLWLVPALVAGASAPPVDPAHVRDFGPLVLLALAVTSAVSAGDKAIAFTPAEVNFLFVAPFTRRQLLLYKLSKAAAGSLVMALALSLATRRFSPFWPAAFTGALLALLFVNLCTTGAGLLRKSAGLRAWTPLRQVAASVLVLALAGVVAAAVVRNPHLVSTAGHLARAPAVRVALLPLAPFTRAYAAADALDLLTWGAAALLIDAALLAAVLRLDANYLEAAAAAGERAYEQARRLARGDWTAPAGAGGAKLRVPALPFLGGAGPVARRQFTALVRRAPRLLFMAIMTLATVVPIVLLARRLPNVRGALVPTVGWLTVLMAGTLRFDFRGDVDQLPWLKSLPLRPLPLALGQLAAPAMALALFHVVVFASIAVAIEPLRRPMLAAIVLAGPFDLLLVALENLAFLLFPYRQVMPTELSGLGRQMVLFLLKMLTTTIAASVAAAAGGLVYFVTHSPAAAVAAAAVVLGVEALLLVPLVALAYTRFDAGSDVPP